MLSHSRGLLRDRRGFTLIAVIIFVLLITVVGIAFFAIASYETKGALYREESNEAFYLADGAIERTRAKFLEDRSWTAGWDSVTAGRGSYDLAVTRPAAYDTFSNVVRLDATGHVGKAVRKIEVYTQVPPTATELPLLVMGDAEVGGNLCLSGSAHVNGSATGNNGHGDPHFTCGGDFDEGYPIYPPYIYTEPDHFPNATYYYVRGTKVGSTADANVYDGGNNLIAGFPSMAGVTGYNNGSKTFTFTFDTGAISDYFADPGGYFQRLPGTVAVVVNFGEPPDLPGAKYQAVVFDGNSSSIVHATIINSKFQGAIEPDDRLDWTKWEGWDESSSSPNKKITVKQIIFEPYYGIAMIAENMERVGSSQAYLGTTNYPALVYLTRDVTVINSNFDLVGSLICLRDFHSTGGPNVTYNAGFIPNLPGYLRDNWPPGVSGTLKILRWREIASS
jgi:Tfp pilus assembly protein PilE